MTVSAHNGLTAPADRGASEDALAVSPDRDKPCLRHARASR